MESKKKKPAREKHKQMDSATGNPENVNNNKSINVRHQWNETEKLSSTAMKGRSKLILPMNC